MARGLRRVATIAGAMFLVVLCVAALLVALGSWWFAPDAEAAARHPLVPSAVDFDGDGVDDYTDLLDGARAEAEAAPAYDSGYYEGGYPPEDRGACTDTVWRAFAAAGYDLKAMVDADIAHDPAAYAQVAPSPDPNIDFRRVGVLSAFFSRYATGLSCDTSDASLWQAGDIVIFGEDEHIGVVSDQRDARGVPFIIHNMGQPFREEDYLAYPWAMRPTAHYRFDATMIPASVLVAFDGALPYRDQGEPGGAYDAAALRVSCYPLLGPSGAAYTTDPGLIDEAWDLLSGPCSYESGSSQGAQLGGHAAGGYSAGFSLVAADGRTLASATLSTRDDAWYREAGGAKFVYDDANAIDEFADGCIEQAREETYLAESEGRMLPPGERMWLTPEEYEDSVLEGASAQP